MSRGDQIGLRGLHGMQEGLEAVSWQPLYDTRLVEPGTTSIDFFLQPVGMGAPPKTLADTNMWLGSVLPRGQRFLCTGIALCSGAANLKELLDVGYLELRVGNRMYLTLGPLSNFYFGRRELAPWWRRWLQRVRDWIDRLLGVTRPTLYEITALQVPDSMGFLVRLGFSEPLKLSAPIRLTVLLGGYLWVPAQ